MVEQVSHFDLGRFLDVVESAPPTAAVAVFAAELGRWLGADHVAFLITDLSGKALVPLAIPSDHDSREAVLPAVLPLVEHRAHNRALTTQRVQVEVRDGVTSFLAPVTTRGDTIGVLEVRVPSDSAGALADVVGDAAHALAYVITTEGRHSDLYESARRSAPVSLAAEIQRRLLPSALTCEAGPLTVSAWLEPAHEVGGDTFDYAVEGNSLYLSLTDAMGHDIDAAILATLTTAALRNGRRRGIPLEEIALRASDAIFDQRHGNGFVTGQIAMVDLVTGVLSVVNAGHPPPVVARQGRVTRLDLRADCPFGVLSDPAYRVQRFTLQAGDRVVFVTDGMLESKAARIDLDALVLDTRLLHSRQALQILMRELIATTGGMLHDDAAVLCVDWYGTGHRRKATAGELRDHN